MTTQRWKNLAIWQLADRLAHRVYALTKVFPKEELYALTSQLRRRCTPRTINKDPIGIPGLRKRQ